METPPSAAICEGFGTVIDKTAYSMTLFQDAGSDPRLAARRFADLLACFGSIGNSILGLPLDFGERKGAIAASIARTAHRPDLEINALYYAGVLSGIGAVGNAALRKGTPPTARIAAMLRWDVPADAARICEQIAGLPAGTADIVRWHMENWDGTGYPDQLRWHTIPVPAQILHLGDVAARVTDPEDALATVNLESGRTYAPEMARTYSSWFHLTGGALDAGGAPLDALAPEASSAVDLLDTMADRLDEHNGTPDRWRRVSALAEGVAEALGAGDEDRRALAIASMLFGIGEAAAEEPENVKFDPLSRLGSAERARNADTAARVLATRETLHAAEATVRSRSEWYDGSGKPGGLQHDAIALSSRILSACIAYEAIDQAHRTQPRPDRLRPIERIETASGSQFDPTVTRALAVVARTHA